VIKSARMQAKARFGEAQPEQIAHDLAGAAMWRGQPRQHDANAATTTIPSRMA
jgi:hypothetical protein